CVDAAAGGPARNWEDGTAHTPSRGQKVSLDNAAGTLGPLQSGVQCNLGGSSSVGGGGYGRRGAGTACRRGTSTPLSPPHPRGNSTCSRERGALMREQQVCPLSRPT